MTYFDVALKNKETGLEEVKSVRAESYEEAEILVLEQFPGYVLAEDKSDYTVFVLTQHFTKEDLIELGLAVDSTKDAIEKASNLLYGHLTDVSLSRCEHLSTIRRKIDDYIGNSVDSISDN